MITPSWTRIKSRPLHIGTTIPHLHPATVLVYTLISSLVFRFMKVRRNRVYVRGSFQ